MDVGGCKIVNVYKPPTWQLVQTAIPVFLHSCLYDDFNRQHTHWSYNSTTQHGKCLVDWVAKGNFSLLHNPKDALSFFSGRWNTKTNPDLALASAGLNSLQLHGRILEFVRSQHQRSLIMASKKSDPSPHEPYKRWNFHKVNWEMYSLTTNKIFQELPPPAFSCVNEAYQDFCNTILAAA